MELRNIDFDLIEPFLLFQSALCLEKNKDWTILKLRPQ